jgi:hypothetical protein
MPDTWHGNSSIFAAQMEEALQNVDRACHPGYELEAPAAAATSATLRLRPRLRLRAPLEDPASASAIVASWGRLNQAKRR